LVEERFGERKWGIECLKNDLIACQDLLMSILGLRDASVVVMERDDASTLQCGVGGGKIGCDIKSPSKALLSYPPNIRWPSSFSF